MLSGRVTTERHRRHPTTAGGIALDTARNFVALLDSNDASQTLRGIRLASIGPVTSATLRELGLPVDVEAEEYTIPGLAKALAELSKSATDRHQH